MAKNTGKPSERAFEARLSSAGKAAYFYRIKDAAAIKGLTGKIGNVDATPSDYIVVIDGLTEFAEVKSTLDPERFSFSLLGKGQNSHAQRILTAGGGYRIYIHALVSGQWYRIPRLAIDSYQKFGRASLRWDEMNFYRWDV